MSNIEPARLADALKSAPVWARLALTSSSESLVDRAADTLAAVIIAKLEGQEPIRDDRQMSLL